MTEKINSYENNKLINHLFTVFQESKDLNDITDLITSFISIIKNCESPDIFYNMLNLEKLFTENKITINEKEQMDNFFQRLNRSIEIQQRGDKLQRDTIFVGGYYGAFLYGVDPDELIACAQIIDNLYKEALRKNSLGTIKETHKYFEDLIQSPRPLPEIVRGYFDIGPTFFQMLKDIPVEEWEEKSLQILKNNIPLFKAHAEMVLNNIERWIPKVLDGYKDLVEGDFRALLAWLITLLDIIDRNIYDYEKWKRKNIEKKINKLKNRYPKLVDCCNVHIRNSIAHVDYDIDSEQLIITFRDIQWTDRLALMDFKRLYSKMASLIELSLFISDPKDDELLEKLSKHRDPDLWRDRAK